MKILGIDTSSKILCVGLSNDKSQILEYNLDSAIPHSNLLLPTIKKALKRSKISLSEIDYFAVGLGPGSFTGLRIALALIKAFAFALGKPVVGVSSLDIIAYNAPQSQGFTPLETIGQRGKSKVSLTGFICPIVDAKRNLLYTAIYKKSLNQLRRISPYLLITLKDLLKMAESKLPLTFLGDGLAIYQQKLKQKFNLILNEDAWYPKAQNLIKLSVDLIKKGRLADAAGLKPIYLYPKECQIKNPKFKTQNAK